MKIAIVVSRYNSDITDALLQGALETLKENRVKAKNIDLAYVPGSFELPLAVARFARLRAYSAEATLAAKAGRGSGGQAKSKKYDGIIALGSIVRGETDHDFFLATAVTNALMDIQIEHGIPVGLGVLTTNNLAQARARSRGSHNNGGNAARAVLAMI